MPASQPTHRFRVGDPVQVERVNPPAIRARLTTFAARAASSPCCMARLSIRSTTATSIRLCVVWSSGCAMCSAAVARTRCRSTCTRIGSCPPALATSRFWTDLCRSRYIRFGSKADICGARRHVRFTPQKPTCDVQLGMSAKCQKRTFLSSIEMPLCASIRRTVGWQTCRGRHD
jgi:hypothetical protein